MKRADRCAHVQSHLPSHVTGELPWWRRRLVDRHLRGCDNCSEELLRQRQLAAELAALAPGGDEATAGVPEGLLETLIEDARNPDLRARAAVPARGAVSGARPELSAAFAIAILAMIGGALWAGWRLGRAWSNRR